MPLYEYECKGCDGHFEVLVRSSSSDTRPNCPDCGSAQVRKLLSVVARPVRSGAAMTDTATPWTDSGGGGCCGGACGCGH